LYATVSTRPAAPPILGYRLLGKAATMRGEDNGDGRRDDEGLRGLKVLLVEDDAIVAFDVEGILRDLGCAIVFVASSVEEALAALRTGQPDAALLDLSVRDGRVTPVAQALATAGVPFAVVTGYDADKLNEEPVLRTALYLGKPYGRSDIRHTLAQLAATPRAA
jgi:CheY-like chemotaxis protein